MLTARIELTDNGDSISLVMKGHAGQNDIGKDIICSASSILAYTLAQNVSDMHTVKKLRKKPTVDMKSGNAKIVCKPKKEYFDEALHTYMVIGRGLELLAHNYPQYVQLESVDSGK